MRSHTYGSFTLVWISWWVYKLVVFPYGLVSFSHREKSNWVWMHHYNPCEKFGLLIGQICLGRSNKSKYRKKVLCCGLVENLRFISWLIASCTDLRASIFTSPHSEEKAYVSTGSFLPQTWNVHLVVCLDSGHVETINLQLWSSFGPALRPFGGCGLGCFGPHPSVITVFISAQMNHTKGEN